MTRVPELMAAGVNVAFGHDCVMDPSYGLGQADMLEVAHTGLHAAQMTGQKAIRAGFDAVTVNAAKVMLRAGGGLRCELCAVARDAVEVTRLRANRLRFGAKGRWWQRRRTQWRSWRCLGGRIQPGLRLSGRLLAALAHAIVGVPLFTYNQSSLIIIIHHANHHRS